MGAWAARLAVAVVIVAAAAPAARADDAAYIGLGVLSWRYSENGTGVDAAATGLSVRAGTDLSDHLGVGAEVGGGGTDTVIVSGTEYDLRLQLLVRLHARLTVPVSFVRLYGLAGIATAQMESHLASPGPPGPTRLTVDDTSTGPSVGAGAEVRLAGGLFAGLEWVRYLGASGFDLDTASLFARYRFE